MTNYKHLDGTGLAQVWENVKAADAKKVDKVEGKGLSTNDYDAAAVAEVAKVANKVDKVEGKGLSTNDYDAAAVAEVAKVAGKADKATTLTGYGITDAYTKEQVYTQSETDAAIAAAVSTLYKFKGSEAFENLPAVSGESVTVKAGDVYNVTNAFTSTADFKDGAGVKYPAGTNVAIINVGTSEAPVYKWDAMAGTYDFSDFVMKEDIVSLTTDEINAICVIPE